MQELRAPYVVGRDHEIDELERALKSAQAQRGRAVFLVGEEGIGKSRLAFETSAHASALGMRVLRGRCSAVGPVFALRPVAEALFGLFRDGEAPREAELGPYRRVLAKIVPEWREDGTAEDACSPVELAEAVLRLVNLAGRDQGCLLVLEDLHDADPWTLAVVEYLADNLARQPAVLLATLRRAPRDTTELALASGRRGGGVLLELGGLSRADVRRLAAACVGAAADAIPDPAIESLWQRSAGNPLLIEQLLTDMVRSGLLTAEPGGWHLTGDPRDDVPDLFARTVLRRAERLGPNGLAFLRAAAVVGCRFPLSVVRAVAGMDEGDALSSLRAGTDARLFVSDGQSVDWYAFQCPVTAQAILNTLIPAERAVLARKAADAIEYLHPDLPDEWCRLAVSLRVDGDEPTEAVRLLCRAGARAVAAGDPVTAIARYSHARRLLDGASEPQLPLTVAEGLTESLLAAGEVDQVRRLAGYVDELDPGIHEASRLLVLRCRIAWAAALAGHYPESEAQLAAVRALGGAPAAPVDAVSAYLAWQTSSGPAMELARRAVTAAQDDNLPAIACQAWETLGVAVLEQATGEADSCFQRIAQLAREHRLPLWRIRAEFRLGEGEWLTGADSARIDRARRDAEKAGAAGTRCEIDATIALQKVLCGDFAAAERLIGRGRADAHRLGLADTARLTSLTEATLAAHRGRRQEMNAALAEFDGRGGGRSPLLPLTRGLARVFCALLEEERGQAHDEIAELARASTAQPPLLGQCGLWLLLDVLRGQADWEHYGRVVSTPPARLRWNRQFTLLARAVLLGRAGSPQEAMAEARAAFESAAPYPTAKHLGERLLAEAACADGWGDPKTWLLDAERHFHEASVPAVANACRAMLRRLGVPVPQRRDGIDRIPRELRQLGITVREYEVLQLLADRLGNQEIGRRLSISPRTVEKHVASLLAKTRQPERVSLHAFAGTRAASA